MNQATPKRERAHPENGGHGIGGEPAQPTGEGGEGRCFLLHGFAVMLGSVLGVIIHSAGWGNGEGILQGFA